MTWVKLSDNYPEDPRFEDVGPLGFALHTAAICFCSRNLTDGQITRGQARRLLDLDDPGTVMDALVAVGLWKPGEDGKAYGLTDYLEHQPSRAEVESKRAESAKTTERSKRHNKGDHSLCDPDRCWVLKGRGADKSVSSQKSVTDALPSQSQSRSRPDHKEGRSEDREAAGASVAKAPSGAAPPETGRPLGALGPPSGMTMRLPSGKMVTVP